MYENGGLFELEPGDIALRSYDTEMQEWKNVVTATEMAEDPGHPLMIYPDTPILQSLKQVAVSQKVPELEVDYGWIFPEREPNSGYEFEIYIAVANRKTNEVLTEYRCCQEDFEECMLTAVSDTMFKYGKPKVIYISRDESADILGDLSRQLNIKLKQVDVPLKVTIYLYRHRAV